MEHDLNCPTCLETFKDPVILPCGHSFCRACLHQWKEKGDQSCPVCRTDFSSVEPSPNLALRNMCENFEGASVNSENICSLQMEKLQLLCLNHQELVCVLRVPSKSHTGHEFSSVEEASQDYGKKIQEGLQNAKERLKDYMDCTNKCNEQAEYIKAQRKQVESKIKKDFEELRHFLQIEEEARLSAVREEEIKKSQMMKEKIASLSEEMAALSNMIKSTEEQLVSNPVSLMQNFQTAMSRIQDLPDKPQLPQGALLDEAKHVANLKFTVWEQMKGMVCYSYVILDPNTAGPQLHLSEDLTSVSLKETQQRPKNPERRVWNEVLGCALSSSGAHTWDVEVGDNAYWYVGVLWGDPCSLASLNCCLTGFRYGKYIKFGAPIESWNPPEKLQMMRLHVDMDKRSLSVSNSLTNAHIMTKLNIDLSGNKKMYPYFSTAAKSPLKIIPRSRRVTTANK
ncbi:E3 ubiquitin-protein ligase TRIM35-like [Corythoichthys intestinalis]|uniref:E3 ubiquitin-protein ligase TRIM35-like n=1 Tax=Corythoichthys intestinalis TaxID=161448 RepID=UPI0025A61158|nr:E3 ubiquitin-protein ligase TRIM35-like [Corythoichthys intestinalis]